ncbi:MAG: hypothetical protein RL685_5262 [Pseudomonadota bacterium]|jgi:hypothetical protein
MSCKLQKTHLFGDLSLHEGDDCEVDRPGNVLRGDAGTGAAPPQDVSNPRRRHRCRSEGTRGEGGYLHARRPRRGHEASQGRSERAVAGMPPMAQRQRAVLTVLAQHRKALRRHASP